jgi:hypothetical protein
MEFPPPIIIGLRMRIMGSKPSACVSNLPKKILYIIKDGIIKNYENLQIFGGSVKCQIEA